MTDGHSPEGQARGGDSLGDARVPSTPAVAARTQPNIPRPRVLWKSFRFWTWSLYLIVVLAAVPDLFAVSIVTDNHRGARDRPNSGPGRAMGPVISR